jgi:SAM-dependent methyltransferase
MLNVRNALKSVLGIRKAHQRMDQIQKQLDTHQARTANQSSWLLSDIRAEYTAVPAFQFHQPLDYRLSTWPIDFGAPTIVPGVDLPVPAPDDRMGYSPDDANKYLAWGAGDHDLILGHINKYSANLKNCTILDFGCSTGRVLRHFEPERRQLGWKLCGIDIQARCIEWLRYHLPSHFEVSVCSTMPHLPFPDNSVDFIYGISVFTHIKYLWDMWLLELKRILKPNGLLMQSIHAEPAWEFYHRQRHEKWIQDSLPAEMLNKPRMDVDFFYYGDVGVSQVFWKESVARKFWGRYLTVLEVTPPPAHYSFQNWMICRKESE